MQKICILGDGAFGTACTTLLANNGHQVYLWSHNPEVVASILKTRINDHYLPGIALAANIIPTTDLREALAAAAWVFEAVPVVYLRSVLKKAQDYYKHDQRWVALSKGIEQDSLLFPSQIIQEILGDDVRLAVASGPSFAYDLAHKQMTAVTLASEDKKLAIALQQLLSNDYFSCSLATDLIGTQIGGALKNVIALGIGMLEGAGHTDNTKAWFMTHGLQEMMQLAQAMEADPATLQGLCGVGDLILTATGKHSRNLLVGQRLGKGEKLEAIIASMGGKIPEGINTLKSVQQLQERYVIELPLCTGLYRVVCEGLSVPAMMAKLNILV